VLQNNYLLSIGVIITIGRRGFSDDLPISAFTAECSVNTDNAIAKGASPELFSSEQSHLLRRSHAVQNLSESPPNALKFPAFTIVISEDAIVREGSTFSVASVLSIDMRNPFLSENFSKLSAQAISSAFLCPEVIFKTLPDPSGKKQHDSSENSIHTIYLQSRRPSGTPRYSSAPAIPSLIIEVVEDVDVSDRAAGLVAGCAVASERMSVSANASIESIMYWFLN